MSVLKFEELALVQKLSKLPSKSTVAFALCCATRQLNAFETYADKFAPESREVPRRIIDKLWEFVGSNKDDNNAWADQLAVVEALFPEEQYSWAPLHIYSEHALYSLAYTVRCLMTADAQEAGYAARIAYEAADQAALRILDDSRGSPDIEKLVLTSDVVQRELRRQSDDLSALENHVPGMVLQLKSLAFTNQVLSVGEMLT